MSGLKDKLENDNSILSNLNGGTGPTREFALSTVHNTYSINNLPNDTITFTKREEFGHGVLPPQGSSLDGTLNGALPNSPCGS